MPHSDGFPDVVSHILPVLPFCLILPRTDNDAAQLGASPAAIAVVIHHWNLHFSNETAGQYRLIFVCLLLIKKSFKEHNHLSNYHTDSGRPMRFGISSNVLYYAIRCFMCALNCHWAVPSLCILFMFQFGIVETCFKFMNVSFTVHYED